MCDGRRMRAPYPGQVGLAEEGAVRLRCRCVSVRTIYACVQAASDIGQAGDRNANWASDSGWSRYPCGAAFWGLFGMQHVGGGRAAFIRRWADGGRRRAHGDGGRSRWRRAGGPGDRRYPADPQPALVFDMLAKRGLVTRLDLHDRKFGKVWNDFLANTQRALNMENAVPNQMLSHLT